MQYLHRKTGYDALPKQVKNFDDAKTFYFSDGATNILYRGLHDSQNMKVSELLEQLKLGNDIPISGSMNSTKGRGIYLSTSEFLVKMHTKKGTNGVVTQWGIDKDARMINFEILVDIISRNKEFSALERKKTYETNVEIIAILCGYDTIEIKSTINLLNRGMLLCVK